MATAPATPKITYCAPASAFGARSADEQYKPDEKRSFASAWSKKKPLVIKKLDAEAKSEPRKKRSKRRGRDFSKLKGLWSPDDVLSLKYSRFTVYGCGGEARHWLVIGIARAAAATRCPAPDCDPQTHTVRSGKQQSCLACGGPLTKNKRQFCSIECREKSESVVPDVARTYATSTAAAIAEIFAMEEEPSNEPPSEVEPAEAFAKWMEEQK
jgi:hypothetical protein